MKMKIHRQIMLFLFLGFWLMPPLVSYAQEGSKHYIVLIDQSGSMLYRFKVKNKNNERFKIENVNESVSLTIKYDSLGRINRIQQAFEQTIQIIRNGDELRGISSFEEGDYLSVAYFGLPKNFQTFQVNDFIREIHHAPNLEAQLPERTIRFHFGFRSIAIPAAMEYFSMRLGNQKKKSQLFVFLIGDGEFNVTEEILDEIATAESINKDMQKARILKEMYQTFYKNSVSTPLANFFLKDQKTDLNCRFCPLENSNTRYSINNLEIISGIKTEVYNMVPQSVHGLIQESELPPEGPLQLDLFQDGRMKLNQPIQKMKEISLCLLSNPTNCQTVPHDQIKITTSPLGIDSSNNPLVFLPQWNHLKLSFPVGSIQRLKEVPQELSGVFRFFGGKAFKNYQEFNQAFQNLHPGYIITLETIAALQQPEYQVSEEIINQLSNLRGKVFSDQSSFFQALKTEIGEEAFAKHEKQIVYHSTLYRDYVKKWGDLVHIAQVSNIKMYLQISSQDSLYGQMTFTEKREYSPVTLTPNFIEYFDDNTEFQLPKTYRPCPSSDKKTNLILFQVCPEDLTSVLLNISFVVAMLLALGYWFYMNQKPDTPKGRTENPFLQDQE